jgi:hypothetical protein
MKASISMTSTTYARVAQTTARPRPSRVIGGLGHALGNAMADAGWLTQPFMASIKCPARRLGKVPT